MIKYRTRFNEIEIFDVLGETEKWVLRRGGGAIKQFREAKRSSFSNWHDSFEDAKAFLVNQAECEVLNAQAALEAAQARLAQARALREDQPIQ
jgi:hypothetical protein